jgi:hypothetical protein
MSESIITKTACQLNISKETIQLVADTLIHNMSWQDIDNYHAEFRKGQIYEDAGGYFLRCVGKLIGAKSKYCDLYNHKKSLKDTLNREV